MIKKVISGCVIVGFLVGFNIKVVYSQTQETLTISAKELIERLARIEENQRSLQRQIDDNQRSLQRQIDELKNFMMWGFGIMWTGMLALMGFILWDRRTALLPTIHELKALALQEKKVETALQQYATKEIRFAQAMQAAGLL